MKIPHSFGLNLAKAEIFFIYQLQLKLEAIQQPRKPAAERLLFLPAPCSLGAAGFAEVEDQDAVCVEVCPVKADAVG